MDGKNWLKVGWLSFLVAFAIYLIHDLVLGGILTLIFSTFNPLRLLFIFIPIYIITAAVTFLFMEDWSWQRKLVTAGATLVVALLLTLIFLPSGTMSFIPGDGYYATPYVSKEENVVLFTGGTLGVWHAFYPEKKSWEEIVNSTLRKPPSLYKHNALFPTPYTNTTYRRQEDGKWVPTSKESAEKEYNETLYGLVVVDMRSNKATLYKTPRNALVLAEDVANTSISYGWIDDHTVYYACRDSIADPEWAKPCVPGTTYGTMTCDTEYCIFNLRTGANMAQKDRPSHIGPTFTNGHYHRCFKEYCVNTSRSTIGSSDTQSDVAYSIYVVHGDEKELVYRNIQPFIDFSSVPSTLFWTADGTLWGASYPSPLVLRKLYEID